MAQQVKNQPDAGLIPKLRRSLGVGNGNPLSILTWETSWTEEPWIVGQWVTIHGTSESWTHTD